MDDPIRIGYVLDRYPKYSEGIIVNEILAHEAAGLDIEIFSLRPPRDSYFHEPLFRVQAPVHYLSENPVLAQEFWRVLGSVLKKFPGLQNNLSVTKGESHLDVFQSLALAKLALNNGITHLHAHGGVDTLSVAHMASCFLGFPLSLTLHGQDLNPLHRNHQALQKKIKAAAAVIAYSQFEEAFLTSRLGVNPCKITRTCNGLDLEDLPFHPPTPGQQDILAIGPLIPQKGWECLIRACRILKHNRGEVRCRIIGTGEEES
ncbi:MAG: glycosyltransferase, partial [Nitrospinaceae bacterium]